MEHIKKILSMGHVSYDVLLSVCPLFLLNGLPRALFLHLSIVI